jgi:hypothetical protein
MPEQVLDGMEWVLDARANLRSGSLGRGYQLFQRALRHRLDLAAPKRHVPPYHLAFHFIALIHAGIACVTGYRLLMTMQQRSSVEASGTFSRARSMPANARIAMLS